MLLVDGRVVWKNGVDTAADLSDGLVGDLMAAYELGYNCCRCPGLTGTLAFLPKRDGGHTRSGLPTLRVLGELYDTKVPLF